MATVRKTGAGQHLDNRPDGIGTGAGTLPTAQGAAAGDSVARLADGRTAVTGYAPQVSAAAVVGVAAGTLAVAGAAATATVVNPLPAGPGRAEQVRQLRTELITGMCGVTPEQFAVRWSAVFDALGGKSFANRGRKPKTLECAMRIEERLLAQGRDPRSDLDAALENWASKVFKKSVPWVEAAWDAYRKDN